MFGSDPHQQALRCREALVQFMTESRNWGKRELAAWLTGVYSLAPHRCPARTSPSGATTRAVTDETVTSMIAVAHEQLEGVFQLAARTKRPVAVAQLVLAGEGSGLGDRVCALWARAYLSTRGAVGEELLTRQHEPVSGLYSIVGSRRTAAAVNE